MAKKLILRASTWFTFSVIIPLLAVFAGVMLSYLQADQTDVYQLVDGTELYLLAITLWATTKNELDNSNIDFSRATFYAFLSRVVLMLMLLLSAVMFAFVYVNIKVDSLNLNREAVVNSAIVYSLISSVSCLLIHTFSIAVGPRQQDEIEGLS